MPVFPIQIFKVKEGVSWSEEDYAAAVKDFDKALAGEIKFKTPNFDLLIEACRTTSVALFPNFMFLDAPFNRHEKWRIDDPDRFRYEVATMGAVRASSRICTAKSRRGGAATSPSRR